MLNVSIQYLPNKVELITITIPANNAASVIKFIKDNVKNEVHDLSHLKRIVKEEELKGLYTKKGSASETFLRIIIASADSNQDIGSIINGITTIIGYEPPLHRTYGSKYLPFDKEESLKWSQHTWPILWRGNTAAIQIRLDYKNVALIKKWLKNVVALSKQCGDELPVATIFVDPEKDNVLVQCVDTRKAQRNPLCHSVIDAIKMMADQELTRRKKKEMLKRAVNDECETKHNYLCLGLHVYTTHEPCPMCAMALNHSRVGRLVYVKSSKDSGGIEPTSGAGYGIHMNSQLNWKYEVWKWVGKDLGVKKLPLHVNV